MTAPTWEILEGEALDLLAALPTGEIDAVVTDPPYSSGGTFRGDRTHALPSVKYVSTGARVAGPEFTGDNRDQRSFGYWCALWLGEARRATRPGGPHRRRHRRRRGARHRPLPDLHAHRRRERGRRPRQRVAAPPLPPPPGRHAVTAAETRYGRRGGGWLPTTPAAAVPADRARPPRWDPARRAHPVEIARGRAHASPARRTAHHCASDDDPPGPCDCPPELGDLPDIWAGRRRMALARQAAGVELDDIDRQAIRQEPAP